MDWTKGGLKGIYMSDRNRQDITSRVAITFNDTYNSGRTQLMVDQLVCSVMYWQPAIGDHNPSLVYAVFSMNTASRHPVIGGNSNIVTFKNASLGRRVCPICFEAGSKQPVEERGAHEGCCSQCGVPADYVMTAYPPYFFYFSKAVGKDLHIGFNSPEKTRADQLKSAMLNLPVRDMIWPTRINSDGWVDCGIPALNKVVVFDRNQMPLHGSYGGAVYDLRVVV